MNTGVVFSRKIISFLLAIASGENIASQFEMHIP